MDLPTLNLIQINSLIVKHDPQHYLFIFRVKAFWKAFYQVKIHI